MPQLLAGVARSTGPRPLVVLVGSPDERPIGLEGELVRAGFQVAEAADVRALPEDRPALVLATCRSLALGGREMIDALGSARRSGAQIICLISSDDPTDLVRAAEAGADEAILLPLEGRQLVARLRARLVAPRGSESQGRGHDLRLFELLQLVATELYREDMLHALVHGLARSLDLASVSCLLHHPEAAGGRLIAATDLPKLRDADVELEKWPEAVAAAASGLTCYLRDVRESPLFRSTPRPGVIAPPTDLISTAAIPLRPMGRSVGSVVLRARHGAPPLTPGQVEFTELAVAATARLLETEERRGAIVRRQAITAHVDPLTGCGTLDALDRRIREEFDRARRYDVTFALVLLDVDGMRVINERLGRDGGHRVLADLGRLLQRELRAPDFVARYGGEEFLLLLPETDLVGARDTVHRIRERLDSAGLGELQLGVRCRLTAGVAVYPHPGVHRPEDLFARVEAALLEGKGQDVDRIGSAA
ncbi:MAG: diguanylate cyclase [Gemmatimonadetes bacterium]|nr:diguanylate cyclase [Gemmatimonadota bacterium]